MLGAHVPYPGTDAVKRIDFADLTSALEFNSHHADFFVYANDLQTHLIKTYRDESLFGHSDLVTYKQRCEIIDREIACLQYLAPAIEAERVNIVESQNISPAILMKKLDSALFVDNIAQNDDALSPVPFLGLAQTLINFHFDPSICPSLGIDYSALLRQNIIVDLQQSINELSESKGRKCNKHWFTKLDSLLNHKAIDIAYFCSTTGEPIRGHGDIQSKNIYIEESKQSAHVIDSSPRDSWRIQNRRMDAFFLSVDLECLGQAELAKTFRNAYHTLYLNRLNTEGITILDEPSFVSGMQALDLVADMYRNLIFFRAALAGIRPEAEWFAFDRLNELVSQI